MRKGKFLGCPKPPRNLRWDEGGALLKAPGGGLREEVKGVGFLPYGRKGGREDLVFATFGGGRWTARGRPWADRIVVVIRKEEF